MASDHKVLLKRLEAHPDFEVEKGRRSNHWKVRKNGRLVAVLAGTPGGGRGDRNALARLRKAGFDG